MIFKIQYTGGSMLWPVATTGTVITSNYGTRVYPIEYKYLFQIFT